jgi:N6-L-threonylcarbamoyladenine synthase
MNILGIETSCDETSAAILTDEVVRTNVISSQLVHGKYGGVVPELASRAHQRMIIEIVDGALAGAGMGKDKVHGIAATQGPGLVGALLVGLSFAKAMAYALHVPFVAVNHMEGHLYSSFLARDKPSYPFLSLIVSGGHTLLVLVEAPLQHRILGQTLDDAAGEAFDKVAKMLGLGYPGGPVVDTLAHQGNPRAISFPRSRLGGRTYDFSFSGIKTSVLYYLRHQKLLVVEGPKPRITPEHLADICASFQEAVVDVLVEKTLLAAEQTGIRDITLAGGVSANSRLRSRMHAEAEQRRLRVFTAALEYCTDNAAMIAYAGWLKLQRGITSSFETPAVANLELVQSPA